MVKSLEQKKRCTHLYRTKMFNKKKSSLTEFKGSVRHSLSRRDSLPACPLETSLPRRSATGKSSESSLRMDRQCRFPWLLLPPLTVPLFWPGFPPPGVAGVSFSAGLPAAGPMGSSIIGRMFRRRVRSGTITCRRKTWVVV